MVASLLRQPLLTQRSVRNSLCERGKGKTRPKGGSVHQNKFVTRCFNRNCFGHWSGYPICPAKGKHDAQAHVTSCNVKETVHVHAESFVTSSISVDHELRGAGACDTCCNRTVACQEWMNDYVHSLKKLNESTGRYRANNASSLELGVQYCARQLTSFQLRFMELTHSCEFP